jgi:hypothetical protein
VSPKIHNDSQSKEDDFVKVTSPEAVLDKVPMAHLQNVVAPEYHAQKPQANRRLVEQDSLSRGVRNRKSLGGDEPEAANIHMGSQVR